MARLRLKNLIGQGIRRDQLILAIAASNGNLALIAQRLKASRRAVLEALENNPDLMELYQQEVNSIVEYAEAALMHNLSRGNLMAAIYVLDNKGLELGYGKRRNILSLESDQPLSIQVNSSPPRTDIPPDAASSLEGEDDL